MYFETDAIVLRTAKTLNNDLFLTLFTRKAGKMDVVANGAKSSKSQLSAASKPFVFGHFVLNTKNKSIKVSSCDIIDSHYRIADDLSTLAYGNYFLELCNLTTQANSVDPEHFQLIVEIIGLLAAKANDRKRAVEENHDALKLLKVAYLIKLSIITGHSPNLTTICPSCGSTILKPFFSVTSGGLICETCMHQSSDAVRLNDSFIKLIGYLATKDVRIIIKTKIHENYVSLLDRLFEAFVMHHNQIREIKSKSFIEEI